MKYLLSIIIFSISFLSVISMTPEPTVIVIEGTQGEQGEKGEQGNLGVALPSGTALFETSLQAPITSTAVTMTVRANSVSGGNTLTGYQCFTIDEGSAQAEFVCGTISGTTVSSMTRGVDPITATSTNSALQFAHRRGANVKITDFPLIQVMRNIINGGESFPNALTFDSKLTYSSAPSFTNALDITTKAYADAIANQGAATSTEAVGGIVELATQAEMASSTDFGTDSPHVMQSKYATSTPYGTTASGLYAVISKINGKIDQLWLDLTESFTWTGAHIFSSTVNVTGTSTLATTTATSLSVGGVEVYSINYGDGEDGDVVISNNTTLTSDMYYDNLTIDSTKILSTGGYRIYVKNILTNNGTIENSGSNGSTYVGGAGGDEGTLAGGKKGGNGGSSQTSSGGGGGGSGGIVWISAKEIAVYGTIQSIGGNGANSVSGSGINGNYNGANGVNTTMTLTQSGAGGAGGGSGGGATSGIGGTITSSTADTKNTTLMLLFIDTLNMSALGSSASGGGGGMTVPGGAGGGGGGMGGVIFVMYNELITSGTSTITGGTGGTGFGAGGIGTTASSGVAVLIENNN